MSSRRVLAPSGLWEAGQHIAETGRGLNEGLNDLATLGPAGRSPETLSGLDSLLDAFETEMRSIACELSVAELRSALEAQLPLDRRGLLDLLDLMLGSQASGSEDIETRIPLIDCLITFLCDGSGEDSAAAALQDPVSLTPRLHELFQRSEEAEYSNLADTEGEFLSAIELSPDPPEASQRSALRNLKHELGLCYFVPRVLLASAH